MILNCSWTDFIYNFSAIKYAPNKNPGLSRGLIWQNYPVGN
jgi:hypothetical protein